MKKFIFLLVIFLSGTFLSLEAQKPVELNSKIQSVTLFLKGAQVNRTASIDLPKGKSHVSLVGIPSGINPQSIQVKGEGAFTIASVSNRLSYKEALPETKDQELADRIRAKMASLTNERNVLAKVFNVFNREEYMILQNSSVAGSQDGLSVDELRKNAIFYRERLTDLVYQKEEIRVKIIDKDSEVDSLAKELALLHAVEEEPPTYTIDIIVESESNVNAKFKLSYIAYNAGWAPFYDVRIKDIVSPAELSYYANVFQFTGEPWEQIKLTLSTSDPNQSSIKPELSPWYITKSQMRPVSQRNVSYIVNQYAANQTAITGQVSGIVFDARTREPIPFANIRVKGSAIGATSDASGNYRVTLPANSNTLQISYVGYNTKEVNVSSQVENISLDQNAVELNEVVVISEETTRSYSSPTSIQNIPAMSLADVMTVQAIPARKLQFKLERKPKAKPQKAQIVLTQVKEHPTNIEFVLEKPFDLSNDGKQYKAEIRVHQLKSSYNYATVPKLDPDAFLLAGVTDWEALKLLKGPANVFFEGTYLGKTFIDPNEAGDTLELSLGRDKDVNIARNLVKDYSKKQFLGTNNILDRAWEIKVRNNKGQKVSLIIEDQFPLSKDEDIQIEYLEYEGATFDEKTGLLQWPVELNSKEEITVRFRYRVKYPKKLKLYLNN